nr:aminoglycoside 6-adenylyltransferase [Oceanobacillus rekensis]
MYSKTVAKELGHEYPNYDEAISKFTQNIYKSVDG